MEDNLNFVSNAINLFLVTASFLLKTFLGLAQLSKIFCSVFTSEDWPNITDAVRLFTCDTPLDSVDITQEKVLLPFLSQLCTPDACQCDSHFQDRVHGFIWPLYTCLTDLCAVHGFMSGIHLDFAKAFDKAHQEVWRNGDPFLDVFRNGWLTGTKEWYSMGSVLCGEMSYQYQVSPKGQCWVQLYSSFSSMTLTLLQR